MGRFYLIKKTKEIGQENIIVNIEKNKRNVVILFVIFVMLTILFSHSIEYLKKLNHRKMDSKQIYQIIENSGCSVDEVKDDNTIINYKVEINDKCFYHIEYTEFDNYENTDLYFDNIKNEILNENKLENLDFRIEDNINNYYEHFIDDDNIISLVKSDKTVLYGFTDKVNRDRFVDILTDLGFYDEKNIPKIQIMIICFTVLIAGIYYLYCYIFIRTMILIKN